MRSLRSTLGVTTALTAVLLAAACGSGTATPAGDAAPPSTGAHGSHGTASAPPASPLRQGERFVDLALPQPYTPSAPNGGTDEYRCFLVDPGLSQAAYLT